MFVNQKSSHINQLRISSHNGIQTHTRISHIQILHISNNPHAVNAYMPRFRWTLIYSLCWLVLYPAIGNLPFQPSYHTYQYSITICIYNVCSWTSAGHTSLLYCVVVFSSNEGGVYYVVRHGSTDISPLR